MNAQGSPLAAPYVWNVGKEPRRGRCDHTGAHATRKRQYHDGPVRPSRDASESAEPSGQFDSVPIRSHVVDENGCNWLNRKRWALNSAVECHPHTVEVIGSNPIAPTISFLRLAGNLALRAQPTTQPTIHPFTGSSPRPFPIPSGMRLVQPVFHRRRLGCRYPASSECVSGAGYSAPSSVPPSLCSLTRG